MPKRKGNPKKLSELQRQGENFVFGGCAGPSNLDPDAAAASTMSGKKKNSPRKKLKSSNTPPKKPVHVEHIDGLAELLEDSNYYVSINKNLKQGTHETNEFCSLGNLKIKLHDHSIEEQESLPVCDEFWLYVSRIPGRSMIYFEWLEDFDAHVYKHVKVFTVEDTLDISLYNGKIIVIYKFRNCPIMLYSMYTLYAYNRLVSPAS